MLIPQPRWQPPRLKICLVLLQQKILVDLQEKMGRWFMFLMSEQGPAGWTPSFNSSVRTFYQKTNQMPKRYIGRLLGSGYLRTRNCINDLSRGPYLLCIHPEASELILDELHEGIYGSHIGGRSLAHRAITQGYQWPNMQKEALEYMKKCDQCQRFAPNTHQLGGFLNPLSSPWPFAQWGLDIVGLFPKAVRNKKYLLVGIDYFTKWVKLSLWRISEMWT